MWILFKSELISLVREKNIFLWTLFFPIILSAIFFVMFSGLDDQGQLEALDVIIVQDERYDENEAFRKTIESLSEDAGQTDDSDSGNATLNVTPAASRDEACEKLLRDADGENPYVGAIALSEQGDPELIVVAKAMEADTTESSSSRMILELLCNRYLHVSYLVTQIAAQNPQAFANEAFVESLGETSGTTQRITVTDSAPSASVRYYYALLGMTALFTSAIAAIAVCRMQPNLSALGARRALGSTPKIMCLIAALLATWILAFVCLSIVVLFMKYAGQIGFGSRETWVFIVLAAVALFSTGLGMFIGSLPRLSNAAKSGIITIIACFSSLFAGLYGEASMQLADRISEAIPLMSYLNPASLITQTFYSINYYDDFTRTGTYILCLLLMTAIFVLVSSLFVRRQRYASI